MEASQLMKKKKEEGEEGRYTTLTSLEDEDGKSTMMSDEIIPCW
jgi:hypothetical protein